MTAYYNENDPYAAQWLRNLISAGHVAPGEVDERDIRDVKPDDLKGYEQCHFFAGIGGWSYALRLAGWDDARPVWSGSCPCQPFSAAGAGKAADDKRHLWPAWFSLIAECKPATIFGEQVEAAIGWGWLDVVLADLEGQGYACGATVLPACGVGAPHIRNRLWFVANANGGDASTEGLQRSGEQRQQPQDGGLGELVADSEGGRLGEQRDASQPRSGGHADGSFVAGELGNTAISGERPQHGQPGSSVRQQEQIRGSSISGELGYSDNAGLEERPSERSYDGTQLATTERTGCSTDDMVNADSARSSTRRESTSTDRHWSPTLSASWHACDWLPCTDGKARPVESGTFPLAHGIPGRVGRLRAYGNAIVPQVAAEFISAADEAMREMAR